MKNTWILKNGLEINEYETFPYAFRRMFLTIKAAISGSGNSQQVQNMYRNYTIIAPTGKTYTYFDAVQLATSTGLLTTTGTINSKEFKRKR